MTVADLSPIQFYGLIMLGFCIVMMAGQGLKQLETMQPGQKVMAYLGYFVLVVGPALYGAWTLQL